MATPTTSAAAAAPAAAAATAIDPSDPTTFDAEAALANLPDAPPGFRVQPPRTESALKLLAACNNTKPQNYTSETIFKYISDTDLFLSPIQRLWQCGEFIRVALDNRRTDVARVIASRLVRTAITPPSYGSKQQILFPPGTYYPAIAEVLDLSSDLKLLLFGLYVQLCPDPADSLALFQFIVAAVASDVRAKPWFTNVICAHQGKLYLPFGKPNAERDWTWWHFARRADTYRKLAWLMSAKSPLVHGHWASKEPPIPFDTDIMKRSIWSFKRQLACIPSLGYQLLIVDQFLRDAKRADLICFYTRDMQEVPPIHESIYTRVSDHLNLHAPQTVQLYIPTITFTQRVVVDAITEVFAGSSYYDHNIALLIMDYVRRDESVATDSSNPTQSTLTPYQQREAAYAIACKARIEGARENAPVAADTHLVAAATATAAAEAPVAAAHARDDDIENVEGRKRQRL